jgi:hypothetical protein
MLGVRARVIGVALLAATTGSTPALFQQHRDWCFGDRATNDQVIEGCSALLTSASLSPADRVAAFYNRGAARVRKNELDQAWPTWTMPSASIPGVPMPSISAG